MSISQVKKVIEEFVQNDKNDLLVIKGDWGVGKTYFWQETIAEVSKRDGILQKNYSYVSLFGINSLEILKNSIMASQIILSAIGKNTATSGSALISKFKNVATFVNNNPKIKAWTEGWASELAFQIVNDSIICIDDLERISDNFDIKDVLGLANHLKEQRNCKVVIILNENFLEDKDKMFRKHIEKIADRELTFAPQPDEAFSYVFTKEFLYYDEIKKCCLKLKIVNIRILKRVRNFIEHLFELTKGSQPTTIKDLLSLIILFVWSYYDKDKNTPSLEFITNYSPSALYIKKEYKKEKTPKEIEEKYQILQGYGYHHKDEMNKILISFVKQGFLDIDEFKKQLEEKDKISIANAGKNSYSAAWDISNNSFKDNETEFAEILAKSFKENSIYLTLDNLQGTVDILRKLERSDLADNLIEIFLENDISEHEIKRFITNSFNDSRDEILLNKLLAYESKVKNIRSIDEITDKLKYSRGWNEEDVSDLDSFSEDDFYQFFKTYEGEDLYYRVKSCLQFGKFDNTSERYKSVSGKAEKALKRIASESKLNRLRVLNMFGITTDEKVSEKSNQR